MRAKILAWTLAALTVFLPNMAQADCCNTNRCSDECCTITEGIYLQGFAGAIWWRDLVGHGTDGFGAGSEGVMLQFDIDAGYSIGGAVGWRFCNGLRAEIELAYHHSDISSVHIYESPESNSEEACTWSMGTYMFNVLHECAVNVCGCCWRPFFGAGVGIANIKLEAHDNPVNFVINDSDWVFTYQLIMGIAYPFNDCLDIAIEYRFRSTAELELQINDAPNLFYQREYETSHSVLVSAKWVFGGLFPL